ncbi:LysR family transcriptional regulator [Pyxidicoccus sp. 3LG]
MMDLLHLRYFQSIASSGSMSAAARALGVSQPTLTVAIRHLEEHLGTTLFHRDHSGVRLTRTGELLLSQAAEVFARLEQVGRDIRELETGDVGHFTLGCHESLGAYFLPGFMSSFLQQTPRVVLTLWNGTSDDVREAVLERRVDFGLGVNPRPHPDLVLVPLFHDAVDFFVATRPDEGPPANDGAPLEAAHQRLREGPLIFAGRVFQSQQLLERLAAGMHLPERTLSCGDLELVKSLTLAGLGVGLLPRRVAAYGQQGRLRRLHPELPFFPDTIVLLYRGDTHRTRAAMRLKDALVRHGRELDAAGEPFT